MVTQFTMSGWRMSAINTGTFGKPVYNKYQAFNTSTGEVKDIDANQYGKALNNFKKSRRK